MNTIEITPNSTTNSRYSYDNFEMNPWEFHQVQQNKYAEWRKCATV